MRPWKSLLWILPMTGLFGQSNDSQPGSICLQRPSQRPLIRSLSYRNSPTCNSAVEADGPLTLSSLLDWSKNLFGCAATLIRRERSGNISSVVRGAKTLVRSENIFSPIAGLIVTLLYQRTFFRCARTWSCRVSSKNIFQAPVCLSGRGESEEHFSGPAQPRRS